MKIITIIIFFISFSTMLKSQNIAHNNHFIHNIDDSGVIKYLGLNYATAKLNNFRLNFYGITGSIEKNNWRGQLNLGLQNKHIAITGNLYYNIFGSGADLRNISLLIAVANSKSNSTSNYTSAELGIAYNIKIPLVVDMKLSISPVLNYRFKSEILNKDLGWGVRVSFIIGKIFRHYSIFPQYQYTRFNNSFKYNSLGIGLRRYFYTSNN